MKYIKVISIATIICFVFSACGITTEHHSNYFGFKTSEFTIVAEEDTHGGWLGDGAYYLILDCSEKPEVARKLIKDWKPFPLTENLQLAMYGGIRNGACYSYNFAEEAHWPVISNGVYKFYDRHSEAVDTASDVGFFGRGSYNFSIAAYDLDTDTFYYYELDT